MSTPFKERDLILFTGDSVTDCGRNRNDPNSLGDGYVNMVAGQLGLMHPELNLRFRNTGVGGEVVHDLLDRWDRDCIALQPNWVSILIGVNNSWRRYKSNEPTPDTVFEAEYRELLQRVKDETSARLVICSPFVLHVQDKVALVREDLDPKIAIIRKLAAEFDAIWVDFDAAFVSAEQRHIPSYWAEDGYHPSVAGHALMAETWLGVVGG